ncbi:MAG TPA: ABC transporter ATP-binding protein [Devosiaceae bacterium]
MSVTGNLLTLRSVSKSYGEVPVLFDIDLTIRDGEFLTVLGPSGSGKTTILRLIGGLESVTAGEILLEEQDISAMPINRRPFNTVFQDYALFPHLTVAGNVGYGLSVRHMPRDVIARRVADALELVQLAPLADRFPAQLSGGQRQRVALARALICEPRLILLDEPLAALDLELRRQMQEFLKSIQREIKTTFLFVTHDQEEAISMSDRICVMESGRIRQLGTPLELYYRPNCEFVARFFGDNNLVPGTLGATTGGERAIQTSLGTLICSIEGQEHLRSAPFGAPAFAAFRPEALHPHEGDSQVNRLGARVEDIAFAGSSTVAELQTETTDPVRLRMRMPSSIDGSTLQRGARLDLSIAPRETHLVLA